MLCRTIALLLALAFSAVCPPLAHADEKRLALVLSNQDYPDSIGKLTQAHADANVVLAALKQTGFRTFSYQDQGAQATRTAIGNFLKAIDDEAADGDKVVLFFYAAMHGAAADVEGRTRNFLLPAREPIGSTFDLIDRGIRLDTLISALGSSKASAAVIISNACRNSLKLTTTRSVAGRGFTTEERIGPNMMVAFAAAQGATTPDDLVFANALSTELVKPGRPAGYAMFDTLSTISRQRNWDSQPFSVGAPPEWFCFKGCGTALASSLPPLKASYEPYDLDQLHPNVRAAAQAARDKKTNAETAAVRAREVAMTAEMAAQYARSGTAGFKVVDSEHLGQLYEGGWSGGSPSGTGVIKFTQGPVAGDLYQGEFKSGVHSGYGRYIYASPNASKSYEGQYVRGLPNGVGVMTFRDGAKHAGGISDDAASGPGVYTFPDNRRYEGEYADDQPNGFGVEWDKNGKVAEAGLWANGRLTQPMSR